MKGKAPYSFLYLVQEGQGVDELGGGRGDDPQPDLGVQGLGHDGVQPLLSQQGQHLMDGLRRERRTGPRGFTSHVVRRLFLVVCHTNIVAACASGRRERVGNRLVASSIPDELAIALHGRHRRWSVNGCMNG